MMNMDFSRSMVLLNEVNVINAIINNDKNVSVQDLFVNIEDVPVEKKLDKLCEISYKIIKSMDLDNYETLISMFEELCPDCNLGEFCIDFISYQFIENDLTIDEKIEELAQFKYEKIPNTIEVKKDYLNLIVGLLLNQDPLNMPLINKFNEALKELINYNN